MPACTSVKLSPVMNIDSSGQENNSDQTSTGCDNLAMNLGHVRSNYRCSFCKRGFSNAQALGGHMNIHRKDRARLREFSDENLLSLDITRTADPCIVEETRKAGSEGKVDDPRDVVPTSDENLIRRLPLFAEAPPSMLSDDDQGGVAAGSGCFDKHLEKSKMELTQGEVDLELRLGPEPHDASMNQRDIV